MNGRNQYFASVFSTELDRWKQTTGKTQAEFSIITGIHPNSISRYKKGDAFPTPPVIDVICRTLNVEESIFYPSTDLDKLLYDENFRNNFSAKLVETELKIVEAAGIKLGFWAFFLSINLIRDVFPFEIPPADEYMGSTVFGNTNHAGKKTGFTAKDLLYVKHLQDEVETIVTVMAIRESMAKEVKRKEDKNEKKHDENR